MKHDSEAVRKQAAAMDKWLGEMPKNWYGNDDIRQSRDMLNAYADLLDPQAKDEAQGVALVPKQMHIDKRAWEGLQYMFGGPGTGEDEPFMDCTAWVGYIEQDDGSLLHGLHLSCDECPEEGSCTITTFDDLGTHPALAQAEQPAVSDEDVSKSMLAYNIECHSKFDMRNANYDGMRAALTDYASRKVVETQVTREMENAGMDIARVLFGEEIARSGINRTAARKFFLAMLAATDSEVKS